MASRPVACATAIAWSARVTRAFAQPPDDPSRRGRNPRAEGVAGEAPDQELFEEFCEELTREMNRLRMEHRASLSAAEREIDRIEARRKKLVESIMDGVPASEIKDELNANAPDARN
jgi:flagellar motility protein MotE (MotC chaperone)